MGSNSGHCHLQPQKCVRVPPQASSLTAPPPSCTPPPLQSGVILRIHVSVAAYAAQLPCKRLHELLISYCWLHNMKMIALCVRII